MKTAPTRRAASKTLVSAGEFACRWCDCGAAALSSSPAAAQCGPCAMHPGMSRVDLVLAATPRRSGVDTDQARGWTINMG